ncbi:putative Allergen Asp f 7 like protein [Fusarium oxysporum f. sp. albedinis]|nr:putative Allergen Asp f 7 like protein [Fusarium oxysporum f. sp. albedinis]
MDPLHRRAPWIKVHPLHWLRQSDGILVGYLLAPIDKLLLLMSLALKYNPGFQKTAICCHGFDKVSLNAGLRAFEDGLPLRIATTDNQGIQA